MRIHAPIEKIGYFWLPENPEQRLPGTLKVSEKGETTLEVIGIFGSDAFTSISQPSSLGRILGEIEDDDLITLEECRYESRKTSSSSLYRCVITANYHYKGVLFGDGEAVAFTRLDVALTGFDEWLGISGLSLSSDHEHDKRTATIRYEMPQEILFQLPNDIILGFTFSYRLSHPEFAKGVIKQRGYLSIRCNEPRSINELLSSLRKIVRLLSFAMDYDSNVEEIQCYSREITIELSNGESTEFGISLYCQDFSSSQPATLCFWPNMLFRFSDVRDRMQQLITDWHGTYDNAEPAIDLYFASKYGGYRYLEGKFLSLAQGVESLHRRLMSTTQMSEAEFQDIKTMLLEICPDLKKEWLKARLEYANEVPLRKRIKDMVGPFKDFFGDKKQRKSFVHLVVDTRNYLTHFDERLANKTARGERLSQLCMKLEALFQLFLLRQIGLDDECISQIIRVNAALHYKIKT